MRRVSPTSNYTSSYILPHTREDIAAIEEVGALLSLVHDLKDFGVDVASCVLYITAAYTIMRWAHVSNELSFSTALLLAGVPLFSRSTHWMKRTRHRLLKFVKVNTF
jgi:hypothetical protein